MESPGRRELRIGHAERDEAIANLRDAAADGRLTLDELDARIGQAMEARTAGDLRLILADLLPPAELEVAVNASTVAQRIGEPGWTWQDPLVLTARWDDVVRAGPWQAPAFFELHPVAGNVKLNFVDARTAVDLMDFVIMGGAGDVVLIVDEGWGVDVSRVEKGIGGVKSEVAQRPTSRLPQLMVRGAMGMGSLKVRHPNKFDTWQRQRRLAKGGGIVAKN